MKKQLIRLTESDLHRIIENSVKRILKENFSSSIIQKLHDEHGGVNREFIMKYNNRYIANSMKYALSEITDEMIGNVYSSIEEYETKENKDISRIMDSDYIVFFNDGYLAVLKKPTTDEGLEKWNSLFGDYGRTWTKSFNSGRNSDPFFHNKNYKPDGFRGGDYYEIMQHAKHNGYKIPEFDKDPNQSIYRYGSNLDRTMERMNMSKARRHGTDDEYDEYLRKKHENYRKPRP